MNGFSEHQLVCLQAHVLRLVFMTVFSCQFISEEEMYIIHFRCNCLSLQHLIQLFRRRPSMKRTPPSQVPPVSFTISILPPVLCLSFIFCPSLYVLPVSLFVFSKYVSKLHSCLCVELYNAHKKAEKAAQWRKESVMTLHFKYHIN